METAKRLKGEIQEVFQAYEDALQPHSPDEIAAIVELLDIRGFEKQTPPNAQKRINREWLVDLTDYPADLVSKAYRNWRRGPNKRAPYASGELMESVKPEYIERKSIYLKAKSVLELISS